MKQTPLYRPNSGLARYGSAPGSLLTSIADSVISEGGGAPHFRSAAAIGSESSAAGRPMTRFFSDTSPCLTSESTCNHLNKDGGGGAHQMPSYAPPHHPPRPPHPPPPSHVGGDMSSDHDASGGSGSQLLRHSSSPAGFFSHLMMDNGFSVSRGMGHYSQPANGVHAMPSTRLKSQLSFSRQEPLSQISELSIPEMGESMVGGNNSDENGGHVGQSYISSNYSIGSWDDTNSIAFSAPPSKRSKDCSDDLLTNLSHIESQFSLPTTSLEMATVEKLLQAQQDSVAFKVRAKRGCATHPRSIAERERRTRISEKLRKLQELVPNMDKQTSTADMLDLAVQHIKELQSQVQTLNQERANCTCACKEETL